MKKTKWGIISTAGIWKNRQDINKITRQHSRYALIISTAAKHKNLSVVN